jgi:hypothetical protein
MRFPMQIPIVFWWKSADGILQRGEGRTYDVNEVGAFVLTSQCPQEQAQVSYEMYFSAGSSSERKRVLEGVGQVLRVERAHGVEGRDGFAFSGRRIALRED